MELGPTNSSALPQHSVSNDATRIYIRIDNLFDTSYEDIYGYNTPGIGAYAGLRFDF